MRGHPSYQENKEFFDKNITGLYRTDITREQLSDVCAQVKCFFDDEASVKKVLAEIEKKLKAKWEEIAKEQKIDPNSFPFIHTETMVDGLGLKWPLPEDRLDLKAKFFGLLNKVLLSFEQSFGINLPFENGDERSPVPTFIGFVNIPEANSVVGQNRIWREEITFFGSLFHGKDTHRLNLMAIYEAATLGLLKLDEAGISFTSFLNLLVNVRANGKTLWDILFDYQDNFLANSKIDGTTSRNPFYFNNLMINSELPFLSSCVTKQYLAGIYRIHDFEKEVGYFLEPGLKSDEPVANVITNPETWSIKDTYRSQLKTFDGAWVAIDVKDTLLDYLKKGKIDKMPDLTVEGEQLLRVKNKTSFRHTETGVLYRPVSAGISIFKKEKPHRKKNPSEPSVSNGHKAEAIYGKDLTKDEVKWLKSNGYSAEKINKMNFAEVKKLLFPFKLETMLKPGNEDEILTFVSNKDERKNFDSIAQLIEVARVSDVAALFLIKQKEIRDLFTSKGAIEYFIGELPSTEKYFRQDDRINDLLNASDNKMQP